MPISRRPSNTEREVAHRRGTSNGTVRAFLPPVESGNGLDLVAHSRLCRELRVAVGDPEAIALDRVMMLRTRIADKRFDPDPRSVAERFLREVLLDLLA